MKTLAVYADRFQIARKQDLKSCHVHKPEDLPLKT